LIGLIITLTEVFLALSEMASGTVVGEAELLAIIVAAFWILGHKVSQQERMHRIGKARAANMRIKG